MKNCYDCNHCEVCRWINEYKDKDVCDFYEQGQNREQKIGHWDSRTCKCSECGYQIAFSEYAERKYKYCPNCGADMRGAYNIESQESKKIYCNHTDAEIAKSFIEDVEKVKDLLPKAESEGVCNTCVHNKANNPYCECCFNLDKYEKEKQE